MQTFSRLAGVESKANKVRTANPPRADFRRPNRASPGSRTAAGAYSRGLFETTPATLLPSPTEPRASASGCLRSVASDTYAGRPFGNEDFVSEVAERFGHYWTRGGPTKEAGVGPPGSTADRSVHAFLKHAPPSKNRPIQAVPIPSAGAVVCSSPCDCPPESDKTFQYIYVLSSRPSAIDLATFTTGC